MDKAIKYKEILHLTWQRIHRCLQDEKISKKKIVAAILEYSKAEGSFRRELSYYRDAKSTELDEYAIHISKEIDKVLLIYTGPGAKPIQPFIINSSSNESNWFKVISNWQGGVKTLNLNQIIQAFYHHLIFFKGSLLKEKGKDRNIITKLPQLKPEETGIIYNDIFKKDFSTNIQQEVKYLKQAPKPVSDVADIFKEGAFRELLKNIGADYVDQKSGTWKGIETRKSLVAILKDIKSKGYYKSMKITDEMIISIGEHFFNTSYSLSTVRHTKEFDYPKKIKIPSLK